MPEFIPPVRFQNKIHLMANPTYIVVRRQALQDYGDITDLAPAELAWLSLAWQEWDEDESFITIEITLKNVHKLVQGEPFFIKNKPFQRIKRVPGVRKPRGLDGCQIIKSAAPGNIPAGLQASPGYNGVNGSGTPNTIGFLQPGDHFDHFVHCVFYLGV